MHCRKGSRSLSAFWILCFYTFAIILCCEIFLGIPSLPKNVKISSVLKGLTFQCRPKLIIKRSNLQCDAFDWFRFISWCFEFIFCPVPFSVFKNWSSIRLPSLITDRLLTELMFFFHRVRQFGLCSSTCVCVVLEYLSLADSKLFKSTQSPSHCLSHTLPPEKNLSGLRLEDMVTSFPYVSVVFVETVFIPRWLFHFYVMLTSVYNSFFVFSFFFLFSTIAFVICCFLIKRYHHHHHHHH